jgi:hypothetical protein
MASVNASRFAKVTAAGTTPRLTAQMVRPSHATTYSIGDLIGNSQTGASVVPIEFTLPEYSGRLVGARCVVTAASGVIVLPKFDLLLFRPETGIPFAAAGYPADNDTLTISAAAYRQLVAVLSFSDTGWRNNVGAATAVGDTIYQAVSLATRPYAPFNTTTSSTKKLLGLLQAQNAWAPGSVNQTIDLALDVDSD